MSANGRFLRACRCEPVDRVPVWIMRQAGRYLPEYRALRAKHDFLTLCTTPELAAEATMQPIRRFPLDAAILFSDILIPAAAMGCPVTFAPGPQFERPICTAKDLDALHVPDPMEETGFVMEAIRILKRELGEGVPLIGFAGAPVTLATYMVEGGSSKQFDGLRRLLAEAPEVARRLLELLTRTTTDYLAAQIEAGADAVQLFDTWAGLLSPLDYETHAVPGLRRITGALRRYRVPIIYYVNGGGALLERMRTIGADVIGVDWRTPLDGARRTLGSKIAVQGNLDPCSLYAPPEEIERRVTWVLAEAGPSPGHIFNLGHGILPETPVEHVHAMIEAVHRHGRRGDTP